MRRIIAFIIAAAILSACSPKTADPYRQAIIDTVIQNVGEGAKVTINTMERVDSTSLSEELSYRQRLFDSKLRENTKFYDSYMRQGKARNAQKHSVAMKKDAAAIENLAALRDSLTALPEKPLDKTAYYIYKFSGYATLSGAKTEFSEYYAAVAPDAEVLSLGPSRKGLSAGLGRIIPGYYKAIGSDKD